MNHEDVWLEIDIYAYGWLCVCVYSEFICAVLVCPRSVCSAERLCVSLAFFFFFSADSAIWVIRRSKCAEFVERCKEVWGADE